MNDFCVLPSDIGAALTGITKDSPKADLKAALLKVRGAMAGYDAAGIHPLVLAIHGLLVQALRAHKIQPTEGEAPIGLKMVSLTLLQQSLLEPLFDQVAKDNQAGGNRAIFAQIWPDGMVVKALTTAEANGVTRMLGGTGEPTHSAAERIANINKLTARPA